METLTTTNRDSTQLSKPVKTLYEEDPLSIYDLSSWKHDLRVVFQDQAASFDSEEKVKFPKVNEFRFLLFQRQN